MNFRINLYTKNYLPAQHLAKVIVCIDEHRRMLVLVLLNKVVSLAQDFYTKDKDLGTDDF